MRTKLLVVILLCGCGGALGGQSKATLTATWAIKKADGTPDTCPANYGSVKVVAQAYRSGLDTSTGDPFVKVFDCGAGKGTIELITSGDEQGVCKDGTCSHDPAEEVSGKYIVTMMITEPSGNASMSPSMSKTVDLTKGDASADFSIMPNAGYRLFNWGLNAMTDGRDMGCAEAGVDQVTVTSTLVMDDGSPDPSGLAVTDTFACDNDPDDVSTFGCTGAGISSPMPQGFYKTSLKALAHGQLVGSCDDCGEPYRVDGDTLRWYSIGSIVWWHEGFFTTIGNR
ncbi:MAG: hypothetical protein QM723_23235 [Myxococcaceae bacterium]